MVDKTLQSAKISAIRDAVQRVREVLPTSAGELRGNRTAREVVILNLFVAIQECLDLASHWLADGGLIVPATYAEVVLALGEHGIIERPLAKRLAAAAGLRNLIAHQYGAIDVDRLHATKLRAGAPSPPEPNYASDAKGSAQAGIEAIALVVAPSERRLGANVIKPSFDIHGVYQS